MPLLAKTYALHFAQAELLESFHERQHHRRGARARTAPARVARRRDEGDLELARHRDHPVRSGMLRRRRLPEREPVRSAEGRHRRVHDVRGRQHGADDAGGAGPAHRLPRQLRRAQPARARDVRRPSRPSRPSSSACSRARSRRSSPTSSPAATRPATCSQREHQLELFRWREGHITASIAQRFKRGLDEGFDPFEVFRGRPEPRRRRGPRPHRARRARGVRAGRRRLRARAP